MHLTPTDIITILICFEILLFSIYLLSLKAEKKLSNIFIVVFLLLLGLDIGASFVKLIYFSHPEFANILDILSPLLLPFLYLYIKSASFKDYQLNKVDLLHLLPCIVIGILYILDYHLKPREIQLEILRTGEGMSKIFTPLMYSIYVVQFVLYSILSFVEVNKYKQIVKENYSDAQKNNYKWIKQLIYVFFFILVIAIVKNIANYYFSKELFKIILIILRIIDLVFINWIIFKALKRPHLFTGVNSQIKLIKELIREKDMPFNKETGLELSIDEEEFHEKLLLYMEENKPYLEPSLTLYDLAKKLNLPTRELSIFINSSLNKNFYDFINSYRIKKAAELLTNPANKKHTVLEILYDVGFNSKSSFNTAFKKYTNFTPTEYRKKYLKSVN